MAGNATKKTSESFYDLLSMIGRSIKAAVEARTPSRCMLEAMLKFDFKMGLPRQNLMQLCFSPFANGYLVLILFSAHFMYLISASVIPLYKVGFFFMLDGRWPVMVIFFASFFVIQWLLRFEFLLFAIVAILLHHKQLHFHLAAASVIGIYLSRQTYLMLLGFKLSSQSRQIWFLASISQMTGFLIASIFVIANVAALNLEQVFLLFFSLGLFSLLLFGHFYYKYYQRNHLRSDFLPSYYSTSNWLIDAALSTPFRHFPKASNYLREQLLLRASQVLQSHAQLQKEVLQMKKEGLPIPPPFLLAALEQESLSLRKLFSTSGRV